MERFAFLDVNKRRPNYRTMELKPEELIIKDDKEEEVVQLQQQQRCIVSVDEDYSKVGNNCGGPRGHKEVRKTARDSSMEHLSLNQSMMNSPKPPCTNTSLVVLALKNAISGCLPVSEIYSFISCHFPYFMTATKWKSSIRHCVSHNRLFVKIEKPSIGLMLKKINNLWTIRPDQMAKVDDLLKSMSERGWSLKETMRFPENFEMLIRGEMKHGRVLEDYNRAAGKESIRNESLSEICVMSMSKNFDDDINNEKEGGLEMDETNDESVIIISDESEDELSSISPSEQLLDPRLAPAHWLSEFAELQVPSNVNSIGIPLSTPSETERHLGYVQIESSADETRHYRCPQCHMAYPNRNFLDLHILAHKKEYLDRHAFSHSKNRPYRCGFCRNTFKNFENLSRHSIIHKAQTADRSLGKQACSNENMDSSYLKPACSSYPCLIALALKNSSSGILTFHEILKFIRYHFPYFKTAWLSWRTPFRITLKCNTWFEKIEKPRRCFGYRSSRLWRINPEKTAVVDYELSKFLLRNEFSIKETLLCPENLEMLVRGKMKDRKWLKESNTEIDMEYELEKLSNIPEMPINVNFEMDNPQVISDDESENCLDELSKLPSFLQLHDQRAP